VTGRVDPPFQAEERAMLDSWLEYQRATLVWKCDGLTDEQLRERSVPPSTMSLIGLVRHMAEVERNWFRRVLSGEDAPGLYYSDADPDGDFDNVATATRADAFATWQAECDNARVVAARMELGDVGMRRGEEVSLRWVLVHMIEEYARHNGHADLIRERIDGAVGD
jgi:uncharacterized damage-inducible protein DinB